MELIPKRMSSTPHGPGCVLPFEKAKAHFYPKIYHGIYRDDGLVLFKGKKSVKEIKDWLDEFQKTVDKAARKPTPPIYRGNLET